MIFRCKSTCCMPCPPCTHECHTQCEHQRCSNPCFYECTPCEMPCKDSHCKHVNNVSCQEKCNSPCPESICWEPCSKLMPECGHSCTGFCGDPCPPQCLDCKMEKDFSSSNNKRLRKIEKFL